MASKVAKGCREGQGTAVVRAKMVQEEAGRAQREGRVGDTGALIGTRAL